MSNSPFLIVGLGNPGSRYVDTRHNIGAALAHELAHRHYANFSIHKRTNCEIFQIPGCIVAKPRGFMNVSGTPVRALADFFKIPAANIIVAHDEMEKDFGTVNFSQGGGDHGHNGLKSITQSLKTKDYWRLSLGIGRPPGRMDPAAFVLKPFSKQEKEQIPIMLADAADVIDSHLRQS